MLLRTAALLWCLCLTFPAARAAAQEALVLSGGGSRGLAHAGVFQALERRGYDPDIVVGTSMGAVVGALYAAGYDADEIRERLTAVDWNGLFVPTPSIVGPDRNVRFPLFNVDLDLQQFRVSRGLYGQWRVNRALASLLFDANARSRGDFDRLARRYRAVAADLTTGDAVVLASGDLARAARASMAVPGFFAPVAWDSLTLVDGGIANNVPTSVARELGAQYVIVSDVSRPTPQIHSLAPFAVIGRAIDLMQENTQHDTLRADVIVLPDVPPGTAATTFPADPQPMIQLGLTAGLRDLPERQRVQGAPRRPLPPPPDSFSALVLEAPDSALAALARRAFNDAAPAAYSADRVLAAMDALYTTGLFEAVWPRVSGDTLLVRLDGPPPLSVSAGAHYESDRGGRGWVTLDRYGSLARRPTVLTAALSLEGLRRSASLSTRIHSLSLPGIAWSSGAHLQEASARFFEEDRITTLEVVRGGGWLGFELPHILRERSLVALARAEWIKHEGERAQFTYGPLLRWAGVDATERIIGVASVLEAERRWGELSYTRGVVAASRTFTLGFMRVAPLFDVRAVSRSAPVDVHPALGDEHAIPGLRWGERRAAARAIVGIDTAIPIASGHIALRMRGGAVADEIQDVFEKRWIAGAQAALIWPSPLGAVEAAYGLASEGDGRFDVSIGRRF